MNEQHVTEEKPSDSAKHSEERIPIEVTRQEWEILLRYQLSEMNELGLSRILGFAEGLLVAQNGSAYLETLRKSQQSEQPAGRHEKRPHSAGTP